METALQTRKLRRKRKRPDQKENQLEIARNYCCCYEDPPGFDVQYVNDCIGEGVFTTKPFESGDFLLEYKGDLIKNYRQALLLEKDYADADLGCFLYFFKYRNKTMCLDATNDIFYKGRMVNDAVKGDALQNSDMKIVVVDDVPHLCLFASRDIYENEEIRFDYGVPNLPWRKKINQDDAPVGKKQKASPGFTEVIRSQTAVVTPSEHQNGETANKVITSMIVKNPDGSLNTKPQEKSETEDEKDSLGSIHAPNTQVLDEQIAIHIPDQDRNVSGASGQMVIPQTEASAEVVRFCDMSDPESCLDDSDMDADYVPNSSDSSDSETSVICEKVTWQPPKSHACMSDQKVVNENPICTSNMTIVNETPITQTFESKDPNVSITVLQTNSSSGSRVYDKRYYCPYCRKPQAKLPRHLLTVHATENEVIKYRDETNRQNKDKLICKLRNLGNYLHNSLVIKEGQGNLFVTYRPNSSASWEDYVPCDMCLGYYVKWDLWKHRKRCPLLPEGKTAQGRVITHCQLLLPVCTSSSVGLKKVLSTLSSDPVSRILKSDPLILKVGEKVYKKLGHDQVQFAVIRNTMRELGRLLQRLRTKSELTNAGLAEFIDPAKFQLVLAASKDVAGFCEETHMFKTPSLGLKLGHSLKKCAKIQRGVALQNGDEFLLTKSSRFLQLCDESWTEEISTHALRTLGDQKRKKVKLIPLTSDCKKLIEYTKDKANDAYNALETSNSCIEAWSDLCEAALVQIILFNRRRQGEVSRMKMEDLDCARCGEHEDVQHGLTDIEKKLCKSLSRIEIVGKRGRVVPVILTAEMKKWIDLLSKCRQNVGVNLNNKYIFARAMYGSLNHVRGSDSLRAYSEACGAVQPKLLRSTKLRKQIATLSQILNLKDNEMDLLADFLGHDIRVHREFYRLPEHTLQVAKVSKILLALESGDFSKQSGKSLSEIDVTADEEIGVEIDEDDVSDQESEDEVDSQEESSLVHNEHQENLKSTKGKKQPWTEAEKAAVQRHFESHIFLGKIPKKEEVEQCQKRESALRNRSWKNIKDFVRNKITSRKSMSKKFN